MKSIVMRNAAEIAAKPSDNSLLEKLSKSIRCHRATKNSTESPAMRFLQPPSVLFIILRKVKTRLFCGIALQTGVGYTHWKDERSRQILHECIR